MSRAAAAVLCAVALIFSSCKSTPKARAVSPLSVLSNANSLYIYVPVQSHAQFVKDALMKMMDIQEADAEKITARLEDLYIGKSDVGFEISSSGKFPSSMIKMSLTEKNGWSPKKYLSHDYFSQKSSGIELSIPSSENALISSDVQTLLKRYDDNAFSAEAVEMPEGFDERVYRYLTSAAGDDILLISPTPEQFFNTFLGSNVTLNFGVEEIKGSFSEIANSARDEFGLKLVLEMSDPRIIKTAIRLLQIAMFGIPAQITQTGDSQISITDITVPRDEIFALLAR